MGYRETVLADGPVLYLQVDEMSGTSATDVSPTGDNGTYTGGFTLGTPGIPGTSGYGVLLNGTSGYVSVPNNSAFNFGDGAQSYEIWLKYTAAPTGVERKVFDKVGAGPAQIILEVNGANCRVTFGSVAVGGICASTVNITDTNWHHIVCTYAGGTSGRVYVDGADVTTQIGVIVLTDTTGTWAIGANRSGAADFFPGTIDQVAIYNSQLTAGQVANHYAQGLNTPYAYRPLLPTKLRSRRAWRRGFRPQSVWSSDIITAGGPITATWTDSVQSADAMGRSGTWLRSQVETLASADSWARSGTFGRALSSSVQSSDALARSGTFLRAEAESVQSADGWARAGTFLRAFASSVQSGDAWARVATSARDLASSVQSGDAWTRSGTFLRSWSDSVQSSDAWTGIKVILRGWSEAVQSSDAWVRGGTFLRAQAESVTSSDAWTRSGTFLRAFASALQSADAWVGQKTSAVIAAFTSSVQSSDAWVRSVTVTRTFAESVQSAFSIAGTTAVVFIGGIPPAIAGAISSVVGAIANRLGPPDGGANGPTPGGNASNPRPGR